MFRRYRSAATPGEPSGSRFHRLEALVRWRDRAVIVTDVRAIHTPLAPAHTGPVPQAVESGGWIYVSALFGADPDGGAIPADTRAEAQQLFANLGAILAAAGAELTDVVRVGIFMKHLQRDRPVFNQVWAESFGDHRPARSAVEATDFGRPREEVRYMIEVVAHREQALG